MHDRPRHRNIPRFRDNALPMLSATQKIRTLGCEVDPITLREAVAIVKQWLDELALSRGAQAKPPCRFVVTPNLDHAVLLGKSAPLKEAYDDAALVLADGMPLVWASKILRRPLPERVTGSDLTPAVLAAANRGTKVFFLGASDDSSRKAVENVNAQYPNVDVVGRLSPPFGFEHSEEWSNTIVDKITESGATLVLVGFGAPKQELWVHRHAPRLPGTVVLCVGATIDFLGGTVERAPAWTQKIGAEWIHRLVSDPRRLARRYAKDAAYLPLLLLKDLLGPRP